jgi:Domain of unknown function (DUF4365)/Protein of unknown function C-terminus (DUF2399)
MGAASDRIGRLGVHGVALLVVGDLRWKFREQHESDWGIDATMEIAENDIPTGRRIALQIKSGGSRLSELNHMGRWTMRGEKHHLSRWLEDQLPVLVVLYDPGTRTAYWQHVTADTAERTPGGFRIDVPASQRLDRSSRQALRTVAEHWVPHRATSWSRAVQAIGICQAVDVPVAPTAQLWDLFVDSQGESYASTTSVLAHRLPLSGDAPGVDAATRRRTRVIPLSMSDLRGLWSVPPRTTVYVCENPLVINAAAAQLGDRCRPVVCLGGFPSLAVEYLLMGLGFSGANLKVHTDHDEPGRRIRDSLFNQSVKYEQWCPNASEHRSGSEEECLSRILTELAVNPELV